MGLGLNGFLVPFAKKSQLLETFQSEWFSFCIIVVGTFSSSTSRYQINILFKRNLFRCKK
jgi:hypothetical protein